MEPSTRLLEWYRPDPRRQIYAIWGLGALLVLLGAICASLALTRPWGSALRVTLALVGASCVIAGPVSAIVRLLRAMRDDDYLALHASGVVLVQAGQVTNIAWDELLAAEQVAGPPETLVLRRREGEPLVVHRRFGELDVATLARRINHLRSKVLLDLLRP